MEHDDQNISMTRRVFVSLGAAVAAAVFFGRKFFPGTRVPSAVVTDTQIVRAAIHPGIGIARIGNSRARDGFFIGPEVTDPLATPAGQSHDSTGALKRQAARFRIYGYNSLGQVVREVTSDETTLVEWRVHLANKKAAWYRFIAALDLEAAKDLRSPRRNSALQGDERKSLVLDSGPRSISGKSKSGVEFQFNKAYFMKTPVSLGEIRTDELGRLIVLGGSGQAQSPTHAPIYNESDPDSFNNADGWFDDISDGPVSATLSIDGVSIPVESSWVAVAPPNYAPNSVGWRTMYELLVDTYIRGGMMEKPKETSFTNDVLPILQRLTAMGWLNKGFAQTFAKGGKADFENPTFIAQLSQIPADVANATEARQQREAIKNLYDSFRLPGTLEKAKDKKLWPMLYGDSYGTFENSVDKDLIVPELQALHLNRWVEGKFINDWSTESTRSAYRQISEVPLAQQPAMLDKAALHFCLADAFHPGCELTWPMRHLSLYRAPFRIKMRGPSEIEKDYGDQLTSSQALAADGPLYSQGPGDLTKWMALPWQGDTIFCRSGYEPEFDPYLPSFWPARVPNQVLTQEDYKIVMNETLPRAQRVAAFQRRASWVRPMTGGAPEQMLQMIQQFGQIGVIEARPGIKNDPLFPDVMFVETVPSSAMVVGAGSRAMPAKSPRPVQDSSDPVVKAGWESAEQLNEFRKIRFKR